MAKAKMDVFNADAMPPKDDINGTWRFLEAGVDKIMNSLRDGMNLKAYMSLYTAIHNFCTAQKAVGNAHPLNATHRGGTYILSPLNTGQLKGLGSASIRKSGGFPYSSLAELEARPYHTISGHVRVHY